MTIINSIKYLLFCGLLISSLACSKSEERSRIYIQFDPSLVTTNQKNTTLSTGPNNSGPNWGAADPSSLSDINCFGIFVHANDEGMHENSCTNLAGEEVFSFGPRAGFFALPGAGEIFVTAGSNRTIYLVGASSIDGTCSKSFSDKTKLDFSNHSFPFVLGKATASLDAGDNIVEIPLNNNFTATNKINRCNFMKPDTENSNPASSPLFNLSLNHYPSTRSIWVLDNDLPRNVDLVYDTNSAVKVECSANGEANLAEATCNTPTQFMWLPGNKDQTHYVRVTHADGTIETESFVPDTHHGGINFENCDIEFDSSSDYDNAISSAATGGVAFLTALGTDNNKICFSNGVNISQATTLTLENVIGNGVYLMVRQGQTATISNSLTNQHGIRLTTTVNGIRFVGLTISSNATGGYNVILLQGGTVSNIEFENVNITATHSSSAIGLHINGATGIKLLSSDITVQNNSAVTVSSSGVLFIDNSTLTTTFLGVHYLNGGTITVTNSTITNNGSASNHYLIKQPGGSGGTMSISNSLLIDNSGGGILLDGTAGGTAIFETSNNTFQRTSAATAGHNTDFINLAAPATVNITSNSNGNRFCHDDPAVAQINSPPVGSGFFGNYSNANQFNSGMPYTCP